jgi:hypothetical protein
MDVELRTALGGAYPSSSGWWRAHCPYCLDRVGKQDRQRCLSINVLSGYYMCWRCDVRGTDKEIADFLGVDRRKLRLKQLEAELTGDQPFELPSAAVPLWSEEGQKSISLHTARVYLWSRKIFLPVWIEAYLHAVPIGEHGPAGRVIVPVEDRSGVLRGWVGRSYRVSHKQIRYKYPPGMRRGAVMFNEAVLFEDDPQDSPVLLVEGAFDALRHWPNAAAFLGKPTEAHFELLKKSKRLLVVAMDRDAVDEGEALVAKLRLEGVRSFLLALPREYKDPGDIPSEAMLEIVARRLQVLDPTQLFCP